MVISILDWSSSFSYSQLLCGRNFFKTYRGQKLPFPKQHSPKYSSKQPRIYWPFHLNLVYLVTLVIRSAVYPNRNVAIFWFQEGFSNLGFNFNTQLDLHTAPIFSSDWKAYSLPSYFVDFLWLPAKNSDLKDSDIEKDSKFLTWLFFHLSIHSWNTNYLCF